MTAFHARHVAAALSLQVNKTDTDDARGIAQVVRSGCYRAVGVKSLQSCRIRALLSARDQLVSMRTSLCNQTRGLLKTFSVVLGQGKGSSFEATAVTGCPDDPLIQDAVGALLADWWVAGEWKMALELQQSVSPAATTPAVGWQRSPGLAPSPR